jgi:FkbM family methyltransferase
MSSATHDQDARLAFFEQAGRYAPYLGVETPEGGFVVATSDSHIGRGMFAKGGRPEFRVLRDAVTVIEVLTGDDAIAGRQFVDVGANIGTSTVAALLSQRFTSAVACEPEEESYRLLRANIALNGLEDHVRAVRVGVSNRTGRSKLVVTEGRGGESWIDVDGAKSEPADAGTATTSGQDPETGAPHTASVEVELVTLDLLTSGGVIDEDRAGMLWIDAEGHEGHILEGAGALVDRGVPTVFEFYPAGLDERGGRDKVHEVADKCYTHFVDVRRQPVDRTEPRYRVRPVSDLPGYADRFLDPEGGKHTDLLLMRLDDDQATVGENLTERIRTLRDEHPDRRRDG